MKNIALKLVFYISVIFFLQITSVVAQWERVFDHEGIFKHQPIYKIYTHKDYIFATMTSSKFKLLRSSDLGITWEDLTKNIKYDTISAFLSYDDEIIISCAKSGLLYSTDEGDTWFNKRGHPKDSIIYLMFKVNDRIVGVTSPFGIYVSDDTANTWRKINTDIKNKFYPSEFAYKDGDLYLAGYWHLWHSTDYGETWTIENKKRYEMRSIALFDNKILVGIRGAIIISEDGGKSWKKSNTGLPADGRFHEVTVDNNIIYSATSGMDNFDNTGGVFVSSDTGKTWIDITNNLTNKFITQLLLLDDYIFCLIPDSNPNRNGGIFRCRKDILLETSVHDFKTEIKNEFYSAPPYPQPARNIVKTKIYWNSDFDINATGKYIYNTYGEKIENDNNISITNIDAYSSELSWNCSSVPNGVYFIVINYFGELKSIPVVVNK